MCDVTLCRALTATRSPLRYEGAASCLSRGVGPELSEPPLIVDARIAADPASAELWAQPHSSAAAARGGSVGADAVSSLTLKLEQFESEHV